MKKTDSALIEEFFLPVSDERKGITADDTIVFVTKGRVRISFDSGSKGYGISKGEAFTLAQGTSYWLEVLEEVGFLVFHIRTGGEIPRRFFSATEDSSDGKETEAAQFPLLVMNSRLWYLVDTVRMGLSEISDNYNYFPIKIFELCHILRADYSPEEAMAFFRPVTQGDNSFISFVLENYRQINTVNELAELSQYSLSVFKRRFYESFGETPYHWIKRQKSLRILYLIRYSNLSFTEIGYQMGFGSLPQFTAFCKTNLGDSPSTIRRKSN